MAGASPAILGYEVTLKIEAIYWVGGAERWICISNVIMMLS